MATPPASASPFPRLLPGFLSADELASLREPRTWHRSVVVDDDGLAREDGMRTSSQRRMPVALGRKLRARLQRLVPEARRERLQFEEGSWVRYEQGQEYREHGDAAGMRSGREWTVLLCVRAARRGGETAFPSRRRTFCLRPGEALVWRNYSAEGVEDPTLDHAALPVQDGEKVVLNAWMGLDRS